MRSLTQHFQKPCARHAKGLCCRGNSQIQRRENLMLDEAAKMRPSPHAESRNREHSYLLVVIVAVRADDLDLVPTNPQNVVRQFL